MVDFYFDNYKLQKTREKKLFFIYLLLSLHKFQRTISFNRTNLHINHKSTKVIDLWMCFLARIKKE